MDPAVPRVGRPAAGDLVVIEVSGPKRGHTLGTWPGPAQLWYSTYDQAFEKARQWSAASGVTIWHSKDNEVFTLVVVTEGQRAV
jgi:hypothetical protein